MSKLKYTSFRISKEFSDLLDKIKKLTGASKTFIVQKAVEEYYKELLSKKEDK